MTSAPTPAQIRDTMLALTGNAALAESMYETAVRREAELGLGLRSVDMSFCRKPTAAVTNCPRMS